MIRTTMYVRSCYSMNKNIITSARNGGSALRLGSDLSTDSDGMRDQSTTA
jgi:hypothetical protein